MFIAVFGDITSFVITPICNIDNVHLRVSLWVQPLLLPLAPVLSVLPSRCMVHVHAHVVLRVCLDEKPAAAARARVTDTGVYVHVELHMQGATRNGLQLNGVTDRATCANCSIRARLQALMAHTPPPCVRRALLYAPKREPLTCAPMRGSQATHRPQALPCTPMHSYALMAHPPLPSLDREEERHDPCPRLQ